MIEVTGSVLLFLIICRMTVREHLEFFGKLKGTMNKKKLKEDITRSVVKGLKILGP